MEDRRPRRVKAVLATLTAGLLEIAGLLGIGGATQAASGQLLVNGGSETGDLSGWSCSADDTVVTGPVTVGSCALSGTPAGQDDAQCSQTVAVVPNATYTLARV